MGAITLRRGIINLNPLKCLAHHTFIPGLHHTVRTVAKNWCADQARIFSSSVPILDVNSGFIRIFN